MQTVFVGYLATLVAFVAIDLAWLSVMAPRYYLPTMGDIASPRINLPAAALFYLIYPVGLVVFAVQPSAGSLGQAALYGALFGFFTYMTYDLTNLATLRNWTWSLSAVDMAWGTILGAAAAAAGAAALRWWTGA